MSLRCSRTAFAGGRCSMRTIAGAALLALAGAAPDEALLVVCFASFKIAFFVSDTNRYTLGITLQ